MLKPALLIVIGVSLMAGAACAQTDSNNPYDTNPTDMSNGVQQSDGSLTPNANGPNAEGNVSQPLAPKAGVTGLVDPGAGAKGATLGGTPPAAQPLNPDATFNATQGHP